MQRFLFLILVISIALTACDGRKSNKKALSESVEDFNKNNTISILNYIPESYFERQVDTTLSNGFVVNITTKSNLKDTIILNQEKNNLKHIYNYRTFDVTINITKDNTTIYRKNFKRENMLKELANSNTFKSKHLPKDFNELAILKSIHLNEELSTLKDVIYIDIAYAKPNEEFLNWQTLKIDSDGTSKFIQFVN